MRSLWTGVVLGLMALSTACASKPAGPCERLHTLQSGGVGTATCDADFAAVQAKDPVAAQCIRTCVAGAGNREVADACLFICPEYDAALSPGPIARQNCEKAVTIAHLDRAEIPRCLTAMEASRKEDSARYLCMSRCVSHASDEASFKGCAESCPQSETTADAAPSSQDACTKADALGRLEPDGNKDGFGARWMTLCVGLYDKVLASDATAHACMTRCVTAATTFAGTDECKTQCPAFQRAVQNMVH